MHQTIARVANSAQKTATRGKVKAPLKPLRETIWQNCHGHYWSHAKELRNKYVLVICDYATCYPEAIPLCSIDAKHIAENLLKVFARVGIPREILTDQESYFTSKLLNEVYQLLHIKTIRTSP